MSTHRKHAKLERPVKGNFHSNELAFLGAPCGVIRDLCSRVSEAIADLNIGFADAAHNRDTDDHAFFNEYIDLIDQHQVRLPHAHFEYRKRLELADADAILVNGNHFRTGRQVVLVTAAKRESLERKLDRLTDVRLFILGDGMTDIFPFLKKHVEGFEKIPVCGLHDLSTIAGVVRKVLSERRPVLKGLVFAGGQSVRMGEDKGSIEYHGKPQREFAADLLSDFADEVYLSVRTGQHFDSAYPLLPDSFFGLGPFGGLLSAFRQDPNAAWLAVACDIPLLDKKTLAHLAENRSTSHLATCFHNSETDFPEPMIAIWEPRAYPVMLNFLSQGYSCPRKVLINSRITELQAPHEESLTNVNTPAERDSVLKKINKNGS